MPHVYEWSTLSRLVPFQERGCQISLPVRIQLAGLEKWVVQCKMQNSNIRLFTDTKRTAIRLIWVSAVAQTIIETPVFVPEQYVIHLFQYCSFNMQAEKFLTRLGELISYIWAHRKLKKGKCFLWGLVSWWDVPPVNLVPCLVYLHPCQVDPEGRSLLEKRHYNSLESLQPEWILLLKPDKEKRPFFPQCLNSKGKHKLMLLIFCLYQTIC